MSKIRCSWYFLFVEITPRGSDFHAAFLDNLYISKAPRLEKPCWGLQMVVEWLKRENLQPISFQFLQVYEKQVFINKFLGKKAAKTDFPQLLSSMLVGQCIKSRLMINAVDICAHLCSCFWVFWGSQTIRFIFTLGRYKPLRNGMN